MSETTSNDGFLKSFSALTRALGELHDARISAMNVNDPSEYIAGNLAGTIDAAETAAIELLDRHGTDKTLLVLRSVESLSHRVLSVLPDRSVEHRVGSPRITPALWLRAEPSFIGMAIDKGFTPGNHLGKVLDLLTHRLQHDPAGAEQIAEMLCERIAIENGCDVRIAMESTTSPFFAEFLRKQIHQGSERARKKIIAAARAAASTGEIEILTALHLAGFDFKDASIDADEERPRTAQFLALVSTNHGSLALRSETGSLEEFISREDRWGVSWNLVG